MLKNHWHLLCVTSSLLITSFFFFLFFSSHSLIECILAALLISVLITSQLFWYNPIRYSLLHRIDACIAKITILCFIIYTFLTKLQDNIHLFFYILLLLVLFSMAILSEYYSQKEWLSTHHILFHGLLHICSFIGTFFAFYP